MSTRIFNDLHLGVKRTGGTASEQAMNRATCRLISIGGETRPLKNWCNRTGIKYELAQYRLKKGMPAEMVIDSNLKFDRKKGAYVSH